MKNWLKEYFYQSLSAFPNAIAIEIADVQYTYTALNKKVQSIIKFLEGRKVKGQAIVVFNEHSIETYASILAINFTDNTVLPLELSWPKSRLQTIIQQIKPAGIVVHAIDTENEVVIKKLQKFSSCFCYEVKTGKIVESSVTKLPNLFQDIAYIIFTSGSTGEPKGVPVKQESINAFISYYKSTYDFDQQDRFLQVYDLTFDVAYFSFWIPLTAASCCCILNAQKNTPKYLSILKDLLTRNITVVSMVPTVLFYIKKYLKGLQVDTIRYSFFSGDALYHEDAVLWKQFIQEGEIHNCYGPTETTIVCTRYIWEEVTSANESYSGIVPIGQPFPDMNYKVVDEQGHKVADGEVGELAFNGVQVIDHYIGNSNSNKFFIDVEKGHKEVYYKTGDLVHVNENGTLVFHGRTDNQVKINGYRVEIGEVEQAIVKATQHKAIVVKKLSKDKLPFLKAFIHGRGEEMELKQKLAKLLPIYMIPSEFSFVTDFPMNQNGKIDRKYLENAL